MASKQNPRENCSESESDNTTESNLSNFGWVSDDDQNNIVDDDNYRPDPDWEETIRTNSSLPGILNRELINSRPVYLVYRSFYQLDSNEDGYSAESESTFNICNIIKILLSVYLLVKCMQNVHVDMTAN